MGGGGGKEEKREEREEKGRERDVGKRERRREERGTWGRLREEEEGRKGEKEKVFQHSNLMCICSCLPYLLVVSFTLGIVAETKCHLKPVHLHHTHPLCRNKNTSYAFFFLPLPPSTSSSFLQSFKHKLFHEKYIVPLKLF